MTLAHQGAMPCLPIVLGPCQKKMFIMLHCMSLAEIFVFLCYLVFAIDCMFVIDFGCSDSLFGWHFFDLRTVCVVYALALKIQHAFFMGFQQAAISK